MSPHARVVLAIAVVIVLLVAFRTKGRNINLEFGLSGFSYKMQVTDAPFNPDFHQYLQQTHTSKTRSPRLEPKRKTMNGKAVAYEKKRNFQ